MKEETNQYDSNNRRDGLWERKNKKGTIYSVSNYRHGIHHGEYRMWWSNGMLAHEGNYTNGEKSGLWVFYKNTSETVLNGKLYFI
jgi:antitoxin component YwqK of YwqJK toxin-antitoxin module